MLKRENSITISYKRRVARMLFIIVTIFILLHIPFTVLIFLRTKLLKTAIMNQLTGKIYMLSWFAHFCLFANAAMNPIVYGLTNDNFRRAYHQTPIIPKQFGQFWLNFVKKFKYKVCTHTHTLTVKMTHQIVWIQFWAWLLFMMPYPFRFVFSFIPEKFESEERTSSCTADYLSSYARNNA